ncbi:hypothetical protein R69749_06328 [Paraburkholderia domus]|uniref:Uncharacterized protein n=1 Tax=Paraburkholderia nemoris TaxID=2793076 RepID=A0ABN7N3I7_9BURK|nr:hypothetical protein R69619_06100 [Paraburkholderia nemoris]CAE6849493.1 hypothetical protein R69776_07424 [Paraburkholderia nemoris]CAE6872458.1 hypothetical protein R69749_06328 [Paraburkholderia domus]
MNNSAPARLQCEYCSPDGHATPETKAKEVLKLERARQRAAIRRMEATHDEMAKTTKVLMDLLSDPAFVALLRAQGFTSIPKLINQCLTERR